MTRLLFVSPTGTLDNGAEISIINLMKLLVKQGHTVVNVVPGYSKSLTKYEEECLENNIELHYIPSIKWWWEDAPGELFGTDVERATSYRQAANDISRIIQENSIDLVLTNTVNVFVGAIAAACMDVPHYWLIHEFPREEFAYYGSKIEFIEQNSDAIFSVGGELQQELQKLFKQTDVQSFLPYSELERSDLQKGRTYRIVNVGRLTPRKNQLELIKAFHLLNDSSVELVFIGGADERYKKECLSYISDNHVTNISFLGHLDNPWSAITDKDICVFPSAMETFGLVYVEAVLNGIPTILSDNLGHKTAFELLKVGDMYESGNINQLATIIKETLDQFSIKKNHALTTIQQAEETYKIETLYEGLIKQIETNIRYSPKSIRHIKQLLLLNEQKSKLAKVEYKSRLTLQKIKRKLFK